MLFPNREPLQQIANLRLLNDTAEAVHCALVVRVAGQEALPAVDATATPEFPRSEC